MYKHKSFTKLPHLSQQKQFAPLRNQLNVNYREHRAYAKAERSSSILFNEVKIVQGGGSETEMILNREFLDLIQ